MSDTTLSKWWTTQSCQDAWARAKERQAAKIHKLKASVKAKQDALKRAVENWEVVE